ncbi:MAG: c-type cytochrome [Syntrophotaleaceae bacterium]
MNYPVWYLPSIGGGTLIALIAIGHVFVSHFAVGGGLLLPLAEGLARKRGDAGLLAFTRRFARFFVLLTLVYGSLTGVGIWFVISLVQPGGTSLLIHQFVFAWAAEWVFFLVEIVAISVYLYSFDRMAPRIHQAVGWIYFGAAWCSLFIINGIITFMLTSGAPTSDGSFWRAFFNPSFWPSLAFRTLLTIILAGLFALLFSSFCKDANLRRRLTRYSCGLTLPALLAAIPTAWWYLHRLPQPVSDLVAGASPTITRALHLGGAGALLVFLILSFGLWLPGRAGRPLAALALAAALVMMGGFEWSREAARRPFVLQQAMFSNGIAPAQLQSLQEQGFLATARWSAFQRAAQDPMLAGRELFKFQCYACHTLDGFNNDLRQRIRDMSPEALAGYIGGLHDIRYFMPPFAGNSEERLALAGFLSGGLFQSSQPPAGGQTQLANDQLLFEQNCTLCHNSELVRERTAGWSRTRIRRALDNLQQLNPTMPDYRGTPQEKERLADYILQLNRPSKLRPIKGDDR